MRITQIYDSRAEAKGFVIYADIDKREYSETFKLWVRELAGMTIEKMSIGVEQMKRIVSESAAKGAQAWPPTYAEFFGLCSVESRHGPRREFQYDRLPSGHLRVDSDEVKEKRKNLALKSCKGIFEMLSK